MISQRNIRLRAYVRFDNQGWRQRLTLAWCAIMGLGATIHIQADKVYIGDKEFL